MKKIFISFLISILPFLFEVILQELEKHAPEVGSEAARFKRSSPKTDDSELSA